VPLFLQGVGPCACSCWGSSSSSVQLSSLSRSWKHSFLVCQPLYPALYHQQTFWEYTLSFHPGQWLRCWTNQSHYWFLGKTTSHRPPTRIYAVDHNPLRSTSQPVFNLPHGLSITSIPHFLSFITRMLWNFVKSLAEVKVQNTHCSPLIYLDSDDIEGYHVGWTWASLDESMLTTSDNLLVFHLLGDDIQNKLFHHLPRDRGEADWPVWILSPVLFEDWSDIGYPPALKHRFHSQWPFKDDRVGLGNHLCQLPQQLWMHPVRAYVFVCIDFAQMMCEQIFLKCRSLPFSRLSLLPPESGISEEQS